MATNNFTAGADFPHLLSPLDIRHPGGVLQLRNRVLVSAHVPGFAEDNKPGTAYIDYHRRYAAEGVGLQLTGGTPVHQSGMLSYRSDALWNLDDSVVPGYQRLADVRSARSGATNTIATVPAVSRAIACRAIAYRRETNHH